MTAAAGRPPATRPAALMVLAGERPGGNALARARGEPSALVVRAAGRPVIDWTLDALLRLPFELSVHLVGPNRDLLAGQPVFQRWKSHPRLVWHPPATGPAASMSSTAAQLDRWPLLVTTGDHALLQPEDLLDFVERAAGVDADLVVGMVPYARVRAVFPDSRRTQLRFADGYRCGANLFWLRDGRALAAVAFWRSLEQFRKQPWRIAWKLGPWLLLRYLRGRLTRAEALARLSSLAGARVAAVDLPAAHLAVDVDSVADLALAERILGERAHPSLPAAGAGTITAP